MRFGMALCNVTVGHTLLLETHTRFVHCRKLKVSVKKTSMACVSCKKEFSHEPSHKYQCTRLRKRPGVATQRCFAGQASGSHGSSLSSSFEGKTKSVHFIGVGGAGLSALALLALKQGWRVTGSDAVDSERLRALRDAGADVHVGHSPDRLKAGEFAQLPDVVVVSSALPQDNVEVEAARRCGLPIMKRDAWLGQLTEGYELIAVAGSHGKTTTSAMLALTLKIMGDDITAVIGGEVPQFPGGTNAIMGSGSRFVLEADEYDGCFLGIRPSVAVITNIEWEHVDFFPTEQDVREMFQKFVKGIHPGGTLIACGDNAGSKAVVAAFGEDQLGSNADEADGDEELERIPYLLQARAAGKQRASWLKMKEDERKIVTYGLGEGNHWQAAMLVPNAQGGTDYVVVHAGRPMTRVSLQVPGMHNVLNSLAVIVVAALLNASSKAVAAESEAHLAALRDGAIRSSQALAQFTGVRRRFEQIGRARSCIIYDDYAHHPTEVRATLQAARQRFDQQPLWVVFQPHTYSRLAKLLEDFAPAFSAADRIIITEVYAAREADSFGVSGADLAAAIAGPPALYVPKLEDVMDRLMWEILAYDNGAGERRGDIVLLTLGAGDIDHLGPQLLHKLTTF